MTVQLYLGDCLDFMRTLPAGSVDAVVTDIPYDEVNRESSGLRVLDKGKADNKTFDLDEFLIEALRICKGSLYIFCGTLQFSKIMAKFRECDLSARCMIWEKTNPSPMNGEYVWLSGVELCAFGKYSRATFNEKCKNTVIRTKIIDSPFHPTQKPEYIMKRFILASTKRGDIVFDPCLGSGTTGLAAIDTERNFIGCEIDPGYFAIAEKRIKAAQQQPRLAGI